jgi:hypothetical protein
MADTEPIHTALVELIIAATEYSEDEYEVADLVDEALSCGGMDPAAAGLIPRTSLQMERVRGEELAGEPERIVI